MRRAQLLAVLILVVGMAFSALYQQRYAAAASGGEKIKVLMITKAVERDKLVTDENLGIREVPQAYVEDRAVKEVERGNALGLRAIHALPVGETLMWTDVDVLNDHGADLSSLVAPGSRAVSVRIGRQDGAANVLIRPTDYVDIIGVISQLPARGAVSPYAVGAEGPASASVVLLQRVLVLASGVDTSRDSVASARPGATVSSVLTLSLTLPEAQLLSLASEKGRITVALRNTEDQRTTERVPDLSSNSLLNSKERDELKGRRAGSQGQGQTLVTEGAR